jgi:hypothetical protein
MEIRTLTEDNMPDIVHEEPERRRKHGGKKNRKSFKDYFAEGHTNVREKEPYRRMPRHLIDEEDDDGAFDEV